MDEAPGHSGGSEIFAPNPGPMTLEGTNAYLFGADPCVVIDPGVGGRRAISRRSAPPRASGAGSALVLLTHYPRRPRRGRGPARAPEVVLPGRRRGARRPARPRHSGPCRGPRLLPDRGGVCFSGDLVLGLGSTIVPPRGRLVSCLHGLAALAAGARSRVDLPWPRPLDHRSRKPSWPNTSSTARCASTGARGAGGGRALPGRAARRRSGTTSDGAAADGGDGDGGPPRKARGARGGCPGSSPSCSTDGRRLAG